MRLLKKIFGTVDSLPRLRRMVEQNRWAEALAVGSSIDSKTLTADELAEMESLLVRAGDGLAAVNLAEGETSLRLGDKDRAAEHFSLASGQARSSDLVMRIHQASLVLDIPQPPPSQEVSVSSCASGCSSADCVSPGEEANVDDIDAATRLDLILCSYPTEISLRYKTISGPFLDAFLAAHAGNEEQALAIFDSVPEAARDDLFYFERGSLLARLQDSIPACNDLQRAIDINPGFVLAMEVLVGILLARDLDQEAVEILTRMMDQGLSPAFCHAQLMIVCARNGDLESALQHGLSSVELGGEGDTILSVALLLEKANRISEAESLLGRLSSGGCSGINVPLAEFSLRHGKNIDKALESFKGVLRHEPDNPRWPLRIAQAYLAKGWKKEGLSLLEKALSSPALDSRLREEGVRLLHAHRREGQS